MKKRSVITNQCVDGPVFMTSEVVFLRVNCRVCGEPLISLRARILGICAGCLEQAGIEMSRILIVDPPTAGVKWN